MATTSQGHYPTRKAYRRWPSLYRPPYTQVSYRSFYVPYGVVEPPTALLEIIGGIPTIASSTQPGNGRFLSRTRRIWTTVGYLNRRTSRVTIVRDTVPFVNAESVIVPAGAVLEIIGGQPGLEFTEITVFPQTGLLQISGSQPAINSLFVEWYFPLIAARWRRTRAARYAEMYQRPWLGSVGKSLMIQPKSPSRIDPEVGLLEIIGGTPTVVNLQIAEPTAGLLELIGSTPITNGQITVDDMTTGLMQIIGGTPTIDASGRVTIIPNTGTLLILGGDVGLSGIETIAEPAVGLIEIIGGQCTILALGDWTDESGSDVSWTDETGLGSQWEATAGSAVDWVT